MILLFYSAPKTHLEYCVQFGATRYKEIKAYGENPTKHHGDDYGTRADLLGGKVKRYRTVQPRKEKSQRGLSRYRNN